MTHPFDQLRGYLDGELSPGAAADLHAHLAHCGACRSRLATLERLEAHLNTLDRLAPRADFATRIVALAAMPPQRAGRRTPLLSTLASLGALALGATLLLALGGSLALALSDLAGWLLLLDGGNLDLLSSFDQSAQAGQPVLLLGLTLLGLAGLLLLRHSLERQQEV